MQRMGHIVLQTQTTCNDCGGEGQKIKDKCKTCNGDKIATETKKLDIELEKGVPDGHRYNFGREGDEIPDVEAGDIILEVFLEKNKHFIRKGADLIYKAPITLYQALTGFKMVITHLDGRKILVKNKEGEIIKPGVYKTIKEQGMPCFEKPYMHGHLYLDFDIVFPTKVNEVQIKELSTVLPGKSKEEIEELNTLDVETESYFATDYKTEEENTHYGGGQKSAGTKDNTNPNVEEDEDDEMRGGRTIPCHNQ